MNPFQIYQGTQTYLWKMFVVVVSFRGIFTDSSSFQKQTKKTTHTHTHTHGSPVSTILLVEHSLYIYTESAVCASRETIDQHCATHTYSETSQLQTLTKAPIILAMYAMGSQVVDQGRQSTSCVPHTDSATGQLLNLKRAQLAIPLTLHCNSWLPWCYLKTTSKVVNLKPLVLFLFLFFWISIWKDFHQNAGYLKVDLL